MIPIMVLLQQGQVSDSAQAAFARGLNEFAQCNFGTDASIDLMIVPAGSGFTAAKPSTSVIVSMHSNRVLNPSEREPLIRELCELSVKHTGRTPYEVVAAIRDPQVEGAN